MTQPQAPHLLTTKTKHKKDARDIRAEALKITNTIKTHDQTAVETKAIANGIQRGMELFLRQQSEKSRDLDKRVKKVKKLTIKLAQDKPSDEKELTIKSKAALNLPWILLAASWLLFLIIARTIH